MQKIVFFVNTTNDNEMPNVELVDEVESKNVNEKTRKQVRISLKSVRRGTSLPDVYRG